MKWQIYRIVVNSILEKGSFTKRYSLVEYATPYIVWLLSFDVVY